MRYHRLFVIWALPLLVLCGSSGTALAQSAGSKATIGIQAVEITDSLKQTAASIGPEKVLSLKRTAESMEQQLIDRIHNTRKFTVVARDDLNTILKEQDLQQVLSDPNDVNVARAFQIAGCKYALVVTIVDYQDLEEELRAEGRQVIARKRSVRLTSVAKIYDTTTAKLLETANFQLSDKDGKKVQFGTVADGKQGDQLMTTLAGEMSHRIANRVVDVVYPAKIIAVTGKQVTINRGDGTGIEKGQTWSVYAVGEALIDPDTGENLGAEEVLIGKIRVVNVTPKFAHAEITEDYGVEKLNIVRPDEDAM